MLGATTEVAALKKALSEAEDKAAKERIEREKQEARVSECRCQNRRISGRGSRTVRLRRMVTGGGAHDVYPGSDPLDGGNTLLPA